MSFKRWSWIFTRPEFGMPYLTARLCDIDRDPRTENCDDQGQGSQWKSRFRPFNRNEKTSCSESSHKIESTNCLFSSIHVLIEPIGPGVIAHAADRLVRPLSAHQHRVSGNA